VARVSAAARERLVIAIVDERLRQDERWGGVPGVDRRDDHTYAAVLGEEYGEVCRAWLERDTAALRAELVQVAAVACAWIEELDNGGSRSRPVCPPVDDSIPSLASDLPSHPTGADEAEADAAQRVTAGTAVVDAERDTVYGDAVAEHERQSWLRRVQRQD
jgi:NTP pyrophosphatase (non-canonical NTP hydrolase)